MKILKAFIIVSILTAGLQSLAAVACRPGMNNCPGQGGGGGAVGGGAMSPLLQPFGEDHFVTFVGYVEVPAPNCEPELLDQAVEQAKAQAIAKAFAALGQDAVQTKMFMYQRYCGQGAYEDSYPGKAWIVKAVTEYSSPTPF